MFPLFMPLALGLAVAPAQVDAASAREEAREERLIILRAADQLELQQKAVEKLQADTADLRTAVDKLEKENAELRGEVAGLSKLLTEAEEKRAAERKALLAEIDKLIQKAVAQSAPPPPQPPAETSTPQRGFYHVVEQGQTLSLIAQAYRDQGVDVTVEQIRQANGIGKDNLIRVGQKLFIPKS